MNDAQICGREWLLVSFFLLRSKKRSSLRYLGLYKNSVPFLPIMDRRRSTNRPVALSSPSVTGATTITIESSVPSSSSSRQEQQQPEVLFLLLNRKKKKVSWKDGTVDNEFMQKKSSKKCCIFHKEKPFDEDDSDEDDVPHDSDKHPHDHSDNGFCCKNHDEAGPSS
ncbi:protein phosphatase 1 regulatory subunit INH3 [Medicago truncatula]|nr:protein phosphatase 1 regulatory subunit INH3 [Medicago truncatula]